MTIKNITIEKNATVGQTFAHILDTIAQIEEADKAYRFMDKIYVYEGYHIDHKKLMRNLSSWDKCDKGNQAYLITLFNVVIDEINSFIQVHDMIESSEKVSVRVLSGPQAGEIIEAYASAVDILVELGYVEYVC